MSESDKTPDVHEERQSTGNKWQDLKLATQRLSLWDDFKRIGEIPCARNSLLLGIGAGAGIGFVRGFNAKPFVAANWAVGTFAFVSIGAWNVCQASIRREREQVRVVVKQMTERKMRRIERENEANVQHEQDEKP